MLIATFFYATMEQQKQFKFRPWRQIARELAHETDRTRITQLAEELSRAIEEQISRGS
jgi:hypothetical protein